MSSLAEFLASLFGSTEENKRTKPDISRTEKDGSFVGGAVNDYLDEHAKDGTRLPLDGTYYTVSKEDMRSISSWERTNRHDYEKAEYDCENFALSFMSSAQREFGVTTIGLVIDWSGTHAYNMLVYEDGSVELFEPQNDNIVEPGDADRFAFERVRVII
jgi:hypothetical protein